MLLPGDVVRLNVYSREGDGRDAQVRSMEILSRYDNGYAATATTDTPQRIQRSSDHRHDRFV